MTNILRGSQVVLMDVFGPAIFDSLFKIHKTKCTPKDSEINQTTYFQFFLKYLKEQVQNFHNGEKQWELSWVCHFLSSLDLKSFLKAKKSILWTFLFQQDCYDSIVSSIIKVNAGNNFKRTHLTVRVWVQLIYC